jgi:hypothetical protein
LKPAFQILTADTILAQNGYRQSNWHAVYGYALILFALKSSSGRAAGTRTGKHGSLYRNQIDLAVPISDRDNALSVYLADDMSFDLHGEGLAHNRAYVGLRLKGRHTFDFGYFRQSSKTDTKWLDANVVYATYLFAF